MLKTVMPPNIFVKMFDQFTASLLNKSLFFLILLSPKILNDSVLLIYHYYYYYYY